MLQCLGMRKSPVTFQTKESTDLQSANTATTRTSTTALTNLSPALLILSRSLQEFQVHGENIQ